MNIELKDIRSMIIYDKETHKPQWCRDGIFNSVVMSLDGIEGWSKGDKWVKVPPEIGSHVIVRANYSKNYYIDVDGIYAGEVREEC